MASVGLGNTGNVLRPWHESEQPAPREVSADIHSIDKPWRAGSPVQNHGPQAKFCTGAISDVSDLIEYKFQETTEKLEQILRQALREEFQHMRQNGHSHHPDKPDNAVKGYDQDEAEEDTASVVEVVVPTPRPRLIHGASALELFKEQDEKRKVAADKIACKKRESVREMVTRSQQERTYQDCLQGFIESAKYSLFFAVVIILNTLFMGAEVQYMAMELGHEAPAIFPAARVFFSLMFVVEFFLRLVAYGVRAALCTAHDRSWNLFDGVLVVTSFPEMTIDSLALVGIAVTELPSANILRILKMLKVLRLVKALRAPALMQFVRALQVMFVSILHTLKTLVWTLVLLAIIMYVFAIVFVQTVVEEVNMSGLTDVQETNPRLLEFWSDIPQGMLTLFMAVAGGVSWYECLVPLRRSSPIMVYLFIVYIFFTFFCVFNVVTGVFCNAAIESAAADPDLQAYNIKQANARLQQQIKEFFDMIDTDSSGFISVSEFSEALESEELLAYFQALGMGVGEAWELYKLLDADGSNTVETKEFVEGCLKLKGGSTSVDIALIRDDVQLILQTVEYHFGTVKEGAEGKATLDHCAP